jgi:hypothetical protein
MSKKGKLHIFKSCCVPILTYRAETLTWNMANISKLTAAEMQILRCTDGKP